MVRMSAVALVSLLFSNLTFAEKTMLDYWRETQINFSNIVAGDINSKVCNKELKSYLACFNALNSAVALSKEDKKVYFLKPLNSLVTVSDYPGFSVVAVDPKTTDMASFMAQYQTELATTFNQKVQFESLVTRLGLEISKKKEASYLTSVVFNTFLRYEFDPHTYITPTESWNARSQSSTVRKILGANFTVKMIGEEKRLVVVKAWPGSAAEKAGFEPGDVVEKVNNEESLEKQWTMVNNPKLTTFQVQLDGSSGRRTVKVSKAEVISKNVETKLLVRNNTGYGYIKLASFMDPNSCQSIADSIRVFKNKGVNGLILDLRDNGGGLVSMATCIMGLFTEKGSLNFIEKNLMNKNVVVTKQQEDTKISDDLPTAVLIDSGSASASEVLSIYLQAYRKAYIVGENSFGKGTMQNAGEVKHMPKLVFAFTSAKYFGPQGVSPQLQGVMPDFEVYPEFGQKEATPAERERDLYTDAIVNKPREAIIMPDRLAEIKNIKNCYTTQAKTEADFKDHDEYKQRIFDQQLSVAESVIDCAIELNIPAFTDIKIPAYSDLD